VIDGPGVGQPCPTLTDSNLDLTLPQLLLAISFHVTSILPLATVTADDLTEAIRAAPAEGGIMPPELTGMILKRLRQLQHEVFSQYGLTTSLLTTREIDVIRLVADGMDTKEIAAKLTCTPARSKPCSKRPAGASTSAPAHTPSRTRSAPAQSERPGRTCSAAVLLRETPAPRDERAVPSRTLQAGWSGPRLRCRARRTT
jgi:hypothetical protein